MFKKLNKLKEVITSRQQRPTQSPLLTTDIGNQKEAQAEHFLHLRGLTPLQRNFRCKLGEIDLIMRDEAYLVFVEVRFRRNATYGRAAETIDARKQQKLQKAAQYYLQQQQLTDTQLCRFDTLCIQGNGALQEFEWVKNAFA